MKLHGMDEVRLREWLAGNGMYADGVYMYEMAGGHKYLLDLFRKYENGYTRDKLRDELSRIYQELNTHASQDSRPANAPPAPDFFSLPQSLKALQQEKSTIFKEVLPLRAQLKQMFHSELRRVIKSGQRITVKEACEMMKLVDRRKNPVPFSVTFVSCDLDTNTGGELIHWEHCTLSNINAGGSKQYDAETYDQKRRTNPRHWFNGTRNVKPLASRDVRKLHIWLMLEFNGSEVTIGQTG